MPMHSSTMSGMFSDNDERGQNSRGTPIVAPSGICGWEGELGELPWMRLNCLTTLRRHVVGLFGDDGGSPGRLGLRVFDTGEWPVGERFRCNVKRPIRRWLEPWEFSISWAWRTRIISLLLYPPTDGWTSSLSVDCSCFYYKYRQKKNIYKISHPDTNAKISIRNARFPYINLVLWGKNIGQIVKIPNMGKFVKIREMGITMQVNSTI